MGFKCFKADNNIKAYVLFCTDIQYRSFKFDDSHATQKSIFLFVTADKRLWNCIHTRKLSSVSHKWNNFSVAPFSREGFYKGKKTTYWVQHIGQISYFPFCKLMLTHPHLFLTHACCWLYSWQFKRQEHSWIRAVWSQQIYTATPLSMSLEKECFQGHITYSSGVYVEWWLGNDK